MITGSFLYSLKLHLILQSLIQHVYGYLWTSSVQFSYTILIGANIFIDKIKTEIISI